MFNPVGSDVGIAASHGHAGTMKLRKSSLGFLLLVELAALPEVPEARGLALVVLDEISDLEFDLSVLVEDERTTAVYSDPRGRRHLLRRPDVENGPELACLQRHDLDVFGDRLAEDQTVRTDPVAG